jgi:FkbM family methyltransferase
MPYIALMQLPYAIRTAGQTLLKRVPIRVDSGINQGMRWSIVTSGRGYGSGSFGAHRIEALQAVVKPSDVFWDIGAHKGFMTLAAATMVGPTGTVISIEPSALNRWFLERHLSWNRIDNVQLVATAMSNERGEARFGGHGDSLAYELGTGDETVPVRTIPDVISDFGVPAPSVIKIDAESQEARILEGAHDAVGPEVALLISVHTRQLHGQVTAWLRERDFRIFESWEMALCSADQARPWASDYDVLAIGPQRDFDEKRVRALPLICGP